MTIPQSMVLDSCFGMEGLIARNTKENFTAKKEIGSQKKVGKKS